MSGHSESNSFTRFDIRHDELEDVAPQGAGNFSRLNPDKPGTTETWRRLCIIGLSKRKKGYGKVDRDGCVILHICRGGIGNEEISSGSAESFKKKVLPAIMKLPKYIDDSFKLYLHFQNNLLLRVEMEYAKSVKKPLPQTKQ